MSEEVSTVGTLVQVKNILPGDLTEHFLVLKRLDWQEKIYLTVRTIPDGQVATNAHSPDHEVKLIWRKEDERHRKVGTKTSRRSK